MSALDRLIPEPRLLELDAVDLAVSPDAAWEAIRHRDLGDSPLVRALFAVRTLPSRARGAAEERPALRIDDIDALEGPGFHVLAEAPGHEVAVGAIGKVWKPDIPFADVRDEAAFASWAEPGWVRVAWALRVTPHPTAGTEQARVTFELRVDATDDDSWTRFRRYFRVIGPASRFIRRTVLHRLGRELGLATVDDDARPLPGDELLPDALEQLTHSVTIAAPPEAIWPWLVQMGGRRAGFYSVDSLDNAGVPSAEEIHPELQHIEVGDVIPAAPEGDDGFEVLRVEPPRVLVLGGLFDPVRGEQRLFSDARPERYWHVTWAFALEPLDERETRLVVRARAAFSEKLHAAWIRPVHALMQRAQLRNLAARVEGRRPTDSWRDVLEGVGGAAAAAFDLMTPFLRGARSHWGIDEETAARAYPGDELVPSPRWSWTHGVEIDAPADEVWPWVAQIGADRGGFYSYQWLENLAGCDVKNAEAIHPEWQVAPGDDLYLHPKMPPLRVEAVEPGRWFVAYGAPDEDARERGEPWTAGSWLFFVEPLGERRSRFISRFRSACSDDLATRLAYGPYLTESIGFVMDRRMLLGVRERAERRAREALAESPGGSAAP